MNLEIFETYTQLMVKYRDQYDFLNGNAEKETAAKEYGKGGEVLHRGYYCPSPVIDIVIGNCRRGKLVLQPRSSVFYSYVYLKDNQNRLIAVETYGKSGDEIVLYQKEFLIYSGETVLSIAYNASEKTRIRTVSECQYTSSGKILSYTFAINGIEKCDRVMRELYQYDPVQLSESTMEEWSSFKSKRKRSEKLYYDKHGYRFCHDEEGFLSSYTTQNYQDGIPVEGPWDGHVFTVPKGIQRKI